MQKVNFNYTLFLFCFFLSKPLVYAMEKPQHQSSINRCISPNMTLAQNTYFMQKIQPQFTGNESNFIPVYIGDKYDTKFSCESRLQTHQTIHSSDKLYTCSICNYVFNQKSNRNKHEREHILKEIFWCTICKKNINRKHNFLRHIQTKSHTKKFIQKKEFNKNLIQTKKLNENMEFLLNTDISYANTQQSIDDALFLQWIEQ